MSFPFRLDSGGHIVTTEQGSDDRAVELVAHLLYTRKGERELVPDFGITDPAFTGVDAVEVDAAVRMFGPEGVRVAVLEVEQTDAASATYSLTIERTS